MEIQLNSQPEDFQLQFFDFFLENGLKFKEKSNTFEAKIRLFNIKSNYNLEKSPSKLKKPLKVNSIRQSIYNQLIYHPKTGPKIEKKIIVPKKKFLKAKSLEKKPVLKKGKTREIRKSIYSHLVKRQISPKKEKIKIFSPYNLKKFKKTGFSEEKNKSIDKNTTFNNNDNFSKTDNFSKNEKIKESLKKNYLKKNESPKKNFIDSKNNSNENKIEKTVRIDKNSKIEKFNPKKTEKIENFHENSFENNIENTSNNELFNKLAKAIEKIENAEENHELNPIKVEKLMKKMFVGMDLLSTEECLKYYRFIVEKSKILFLKYIRKS